MTFSLFYQIPNGHFTRDGRPKHKWFRTGQIIGTCADAKQWVDENFAIWGAAKAVAVGVEILRIRDWSGEYASHPPMAYEATT